MGGWPAGRPAPNGGERRAREARQGKKGAPAAGFGEPLAARPKWPQHARGLLSSSGSGSSSRRPEEEAEAKSGSTLQAGGSEGRGILSYESPEEGPVKLCLWFESEGMEVSVRLPKKGAGGGHSGAEDGVGRAREVGVLVAAAGARAEASEAQPRGVNQGSSSSSRSPVATGAAGKQSELLLKSRPLS